MTSPKVVIIGLDSVPPALAFDQYKKQMPHLSALCRGGTFGPMRSTDPPITIPAWISMTTGIPPGQLGMYGFQRHTHGVASRVVTPADIKAPQIWDLVERKKQKSVVVSVPLTYPAKNSPFVTMTTGFLTPSTRTRWTNRPSLAKELEHRFGKYIIDVSDFRNKEIDCVFSDCKALTQQHFQIFRYLLKKEQPQFAMVVDLGPDRLHHAALRYILKSHPAAISSPMGAQYYKLLDDEIGRTLEGVGPDTVVMVVSDHGVKPLRGSFCVNEILIASGDITLVGDYPKTPTPLEKLQIDWSRTTAFGKGGYVGRIFLNQKNREPRGIVSAAERAAHLERLKLLFTSIGAPEHHFQHRVYEPQELYPNAAGYAPDLTIYFDDLNYRAAGTIGHGAIQIPTNDRGPDDANHDYNGIFAINRNPPSQRPTPPQSSFGICDVFATALHHLELAAPPNTTGNIIA